MHLDFIAPAFDALLVLIAIVTTAMFVSDAPAR